MVNLHFNTLGLINKLRFTAPKNDSYLVMDDSMTPTLSHGDRVEIDPMGLLSSGKIVILISEEKTELREARMVNGKLYLVAHNKKYAMVSMQDYRELNPGAFIGGVMV